ncbi:hypothetical protein ES703_123245 [subsurface metagenome]
MGLTEGEAKVYFAMLKEGSSTVGPLVREAGVAYSNIYEIMERLIKKGLTTYIIKEKTKYFQATSSESLKRYLDKKQQEIKNQQEILDSIMPQIEKTSKNIFQDAEIFTGKKGLRSAYDILLQETKKSEEFLFFFVPDEKTSKEVDEFYLTIAGKIKASGVDIKGISNKSYKKSEVVKYTTPWTKMKYVDFPIPSNVDICRDKILFISWDKAIGFLIKSKELTDNFRKYFHSVWKIAKK